MDKTEEKIWKSIKDIQKKLTVRSFVLSMAIHMFLIGSFITLKLCGVWPYEWWTVWLGVAIHTLFDTCLVCISLVAAFITLLSLLGLYILRDKD